MLHPEPTTVSRFIPGYGGSRVLLDGALTSGFDETVPLLIGLTWLASLAVAVASPTGMQPRRASSALISDRGLRPGQSCMIRLASQAFVETRATVARASPILTCGLVHPPSDGWNRTVFVLPWTLTSCHLLIS